ncbi:MAG: chromosomal replication initiation ATPase DnaA [Paracoccaceae bacterium]|jgi:chromosomal replication initiation ATPase DnaA
MSHQLALDWPNQTAQTREDFFISPANALALAMIENCTLWPQSKMILLGPQGSGKSHLGAIWAKQADAEIISAEELNFNKVASLTRTKSILVEDADRLAQYPQAEEAFFHLHNALQTAGNYLLITAKTPPRDWGVTLPDLLSRMSALATTKLEAPDDILLQALLVKMFSDRQIDVTTPLISYLVTRMERSCASACELVERLDRAALAASCPITRRFANKILGKPQI